MLHEDLIPLLETNGIGVHGDTLYWGERSPIPEPPEPYDPDWEPPPYIAFYEDPGPSGSSAKGGPATSEARLRAIVTAPWYPDAMQKAWEIYEVLHSELPATLFGTRYSLIPPYQRPFDVGAQDEAGRTIISTNYALFIRSI